MEELIRKSDAIKNIDELWVKWRTDGTGHIQTPFVGEVTAVECCKTAVLQTTAVEPKQGRWEEVPYKRQGHEEIVIDGTSWRCTNCGNAEKRNEPDMDYCPNCGARMKGTDND